MSGEKLIVAITLMAAITFLTRAFPFVIFGGGRKPPPIITYLGKYFPPAIITAILVYCICGAAMPLWPALFKQVVAVAVVAFLHLWKSNTMLSIFSGVAVYMALEQVFLPG